MGQLRSVTSATTYPVSELTPGARGVQLTIAGGAVYVQLGHGIGSQRWDEDSFRIPGVHVIPGAADAVRVRSAVAHAGTAADPWPTVAVEAYGAG